EDRVIVQAKGGCWSSLGKAGGQQQISLGEGCETIGIAAHEIGHTLGFYHTMSRHDRDDYVTLNLRNIQPPFLSQFTRQTTHTNQNFGHAYDYGSLMHYGGSSAAIDHRQPTMVPFDINYQETLGSPFVSFIDISMMNDLYGCK
ncbi:astacin, partial [Teladorsagia circumcincta]